jgi:hypothetical protein
MRGNVVAPPLGQVTAGATCASLPVRPRPMLGSLRFEINARCRLEAVLVGVCRRAASGVEEWAVSAAAAGRSGDGQYEQGMGPKRGLGQAVRRAGTLTQPSHTSNDPVSHLWACQLPLCAHPAGSVPRRVVPLPVDGHAAGAHASSRTCLSASQ